MNTYKYNGTDPLEIPALGIHVAGGETFEVPEEFSARFAADPVFAASKVKSPDVTVDPGLVTGSIPVQGAPGEVPAPGTV